MINLTRINGKKIVINAELIELIEETPDVVVTLLNKNRFLVQESPAQIIERVIDYRQKISGKGLPPILNQNEDLKQI